MWLPNKIEKENKIAKDSLNKMFHMLKKFVGKI
jgi:hypothetical protein